MNFAPKDDFNERLGSSIGGGLTSGLQRIAEAKMQHLEQQYQQRQALKNMFEQQKAEQEVMKKRHQDYAKALADTGNFTPQQANVVAWQQMLSPQTAHKVMEGFFNTGAPQQARPQQAMPQQAMPQQVGQQPVVQQQPQGFGIAENPLIQQVMKKAGRTRMPQQAGSLENILAPTAANMEIPQVGRDVPAGENISAYARPKKEKAGSQQVGWGEATPKAMLEREKMLEAKKMHEAVNKREAFKFQKAYMTDVENKDKAAKLTDMRLDRLSTLNKQNKLMHPLLYSGMKRIGLDIPGLQSEDMQEFQKETTSFLKNVKDVFGSRVTQYEVAQFLKTIPSLEQTPGGRDRVIRNMKLTNQAEHLRAQEMRKILKENDNVPPYDLSEQIEERIGGKLDEIASKFASGEKKPDFKSIKDANPALYKGKTGTDFATGKKYQSNGSAWIEVK